MRLTTRFALCGAFALLGPASAQSSYATFGAGCQGSGSTRACATANADQRVLRQRQGNLYFAIAVAPQPVHQIVLGFELYSKTESPTTNLTIQTFVHLADGNGKPQQQPVRSGLMTIGNRAAWYRTTLSAPLAVPPNTKFFLSYAPAANQMWMPVFANGTNVEYFWRPTQQTNWQTPGNPGAWGFKINCAGGGGQLTLSNSGVPTLGGAFSVHMANGLPHARSLFLLGVSRQRWNNVFLPWDLGAVNAPGCFLFTSLDFITSVRNDAFGRATFTLRIPNQANLRGLQFFNQFVTDDPQANGFGLVTTNGGTGTIQ